MEAYLLLEFCMGAYIRGGLVEGGLENYSCSCSYSRKTFLLKSYIFDDAQTNNRIFLRIYNFSLLSVYI